MRRYDFTDVFGIGDLMFTNIKQCKKYFKKYLLNIFIFVSLFFLIPSVAMGTDEIPERIFTGTESSDAILENLDYTDVKNSSTWAKSAIWETGALELLKGYGNKMFGLSDRLTVEQAIAIAYNMAGREAEAQLAAEALDLARDDKKTYAPRMWSDGYIQLALNDGLITADEYDDAFATDQSSLGSLDFQRSSSVTREDMAYYIAKVLGINPVNEQTHLFNSFNDWQQANPHRIPYIEALLQNKVMNGDNSGRFLPKGAVTREMAAQIMKNAEPLIFPLISMEKSRGTIEEIKNFTDKTGGENIEVKHINIRNSNGSLDQFHFIYPEKVSSLNEINGNDSRIKKSGTIVNDSDVLKDETVMKEGQEITYITQNNEVLYVNILNLTKKTDYFLARILSVDEPENKIRSEILMDVPFSDTRMLDNPNLHNLSDTVSEEVITVSKNALIYIDFVKKTLKDVEPQSLMLITVENNLVTAMEKVNLELLQESGIISGILEENNPVLGYVTLYYYDGSGASFESGKTLSSFRTFSYINIANVDVYKNGGYALIDDLKPGDSVFLKLNEDGNIIRISGADNFYPVYGKVRAKGNNTLQILKEDGTVQQLRISQSIPVFRDRKRVSLDDIKDGDDVRVLLQTSGNQVIIGEVTIGKKNPVISGIYKAQLNYYDTSDNSLMVSGLQYFKDGLWWQDQVKGITKLNINNDFKPEIEKGASGIVYFATSKNMLGKDMIIHLTVEDEMHKTGIISDTIVETMLGRGTITLLNDNKPLLYGDETIIVKGGKLLEPNQVKSRDEAHFSYSNQADGSYKTDVLWIKEPAADTGLTLLRGRISGIEPMNSMTLESFSQFNSPDWEFVNVQKTLTIDPTITRLFDNGGRTNLLELDDVGANNYKNRTVYVLSQDGKAMMISTAPYGDVVLKGRISVLEGLEKDSFGHVIVQTTSMIISETMVFNRGTWLWDNQEEETWLELLENSVIIRNGVISERSSLEKGDSITVIRSTTGESAYVVIAESY